VTLVVNYLCKKYYYSPERCSRRGERKLSPQVWTLGSMLTLLLLNYAFPAGGRGKVSPLTIKDAKIVADPPQDGKLKVRIYIFSDLGIWLFSANSFL
jgi:hypothetical protein